MNCIRRYIRRCKRSGDDVLVDQIGRSTGRALRRRGVQLYHLRMHAGTQSDHEDAADGVTQQPRPDGSREPTVNSAAATGMVVITTIMTMRTRAAGQG